MKLIVEKFGQTETPGGVELLVERLARSHIPSLELSHLEALPYIASKDSLMYCQAEGGPDRARSRIYRRCLESGAVIVEQNIFALPASDRPVHANFYRALMSRDGIYRYVLRSYVEAQRPETNVMILPCPLVRDLTYRSRAPLSGRRLEMLRIGRPDRRKWTWFEVKFCIKFATVYPEISVRLTLVGAPYSRVDLPPIPSNLTVRFKGYEENLEAVYSESDIYLHQSRIGETFGQTCFEAAMSGCLVVCALDPKWDAAPLEILGGRHIVRHPERLLRDDDACGEVLMALSRPPTPLAEDLSVGSFVKRVRCLETTKLPSLSEALHYLHKQSKELGAKPHHETLSLTFEVLRALQRRIANKSSDHIAPS